MKAFLLVSAIGLMQVSGNGIAQENYISEKVTSYVTKIQCQKCRITNGPTNIGHSTWHVTTRSNEKRLSSTYCAMNENEYWIGMDSDSPKLEQKNGLTLLWLDKRSSCTWNDKFKSIGVDGYYTAKQAVKLLDLITKILKQAKSGKCYQHYSCNDDVIEGLQSVSIDKLTLIGHEDDFVTYDFFAGLESEGHALNIFTLKVNKQNKVMAIGGGYIEIDTSDRP